MSPASTGDVSNLAIWIASSRTITREQGRLDSVFANAGVAQWCPSVRSPGGAL